MTYQNIDPVDAKALLEQCTELRVLDVRTTPEYDSHRIDGAHLLPVQEIQLRHQELDKDAHYLVTCEHGVRSVMACDFLASIGFQNLTNLRGGMAQWVDAHLPFVGRSAPPK